MKDSYISHEESLRYAGALLDCKVKIRWIEAPDLEDSGNTKTLEGVNGVLVPGGFGNRGVLGKIAAIRWAREQRVPFLGLCLGMQCAVIEWARHQAGLKEATSSELEPNSIHPVIHLLPDQQDVVDMGGTMRLGAYPAIL